MVIIYTTSRYNPNLYDDEVIKKRMEFKRFKFQTEFNQRFKFGV